MESAESVRPRDDGDDTGSASGSAERPAKRPRGVGSGGRGAGYSPPEVSFFLSLLEEHLPVTNKEWKAIVRLHNAQFPSLKRTPNSLRRKFSALCRSAVAGADETVLAPDVRRAVHVKRRMKNRGDVPDEDDDLPDSDDDDGDNDDESSHNGTHQRRRESTGEGNGVQSVAAGAAAPTSNGSTPSATVTPPPTRYYTNGQHAITTAAAMSMPLPSQNQGQFNANNNNNAGSRAQAMYDHLTEATSAQRGRAVTQADLIELIKLQLLQNIEDDRRRRHEEAERREEERRHREEERATRDEFRRRYEEERARREQDLRRYEEEREESRRRHEEFMQVILSLLNKQ